MHVFSSQTSNRWVMFRKAVSFMWYCTIRLNSIINTISFERGPRSERFLGPRARQGLQIEASMRARADPGPHSPRGPLSREILLETRLFEFFLDQRNSPASHHEKTSLPDGSTCSYVPTSCGCNATKPIRPEHGGSP